MTTSKVTPVSAPGQFGTEYRIDINGWTRGYLTGSLAQAEAEAARIVAGIEADRRWFARPMCSACDERRANVSTGPTWFLCAPCVTESNAYDDAHGEPRAIVVPL